MQQCPDLPPASTIGVVAACAGAKNVEKIVRSIQDGNDGLGRKPVLVSKNPALRCRENEQEISCEAHTIFIPGSLTLSKIKIRGSFLGQVAKEHPVVAAIRTVGMKGPASVARTARLAVSLSASAYPALF